MPRVTTWITLQQNVNATRGAPFTVAACTAQSLRNC